MAEKKAGASLIRKATPPGMEREFPKPGESAAEFVKRAAPSSTTDPDIAWLQVWKPGEAVDIEEEVQKAVDVLVQSWQDTPHKSLASLSQLCNDPALAPIGGGKWMVFAPPHEVDAAWLRIADAILTSDTLSVSAKVSTASMSGGGKHVICVYTRSLDKREIDHVLAGLRSLGFSTDLKFKADIVTYLELYRENPYGIPVSFYVARKGETVSRSQLTSKQQSTSTGPPKCRFFARGNCSHGTTCRFSHTT